MVTTAIFDGDNNTKTFELSVSSFSATPLHLSKVFCREYFAVLARSFAVAIFVAVAVAVAVVVAVAVAVVAVAVAVALAVVVSVVAVVAASTTSTQYTP